MGLFDPKCRTCGRRTPKQELMDELCLECRDMIAFYHHLNNQLKEMTGKYYTDSDEQIVKLDRDQFQKLIEDSIKKYMPICNACGQATSLATLSEGYCPDCYHTLCRTCGKHTSKQKLEDGLCLECRDMIAFYHRLNNQLKETTGKYYTDSDEQIVKLDRDQFQKFIEDSIKKYMPVCNACGQATSLATLTEGYCPDCYRVLTTHCEIIKSIGVLSEKDIQLNMTPQELVKLSEGELVSSLLNTWLLNELKHGINISTDVEYKPLTELSFEEMIERGYKRVKYITKGSEHTCPDCRKRNGMVRSIEEAIALGLHNSDAHKECGQWIPLRD